MANVEKIVKIYRSLSQIPSLVGAKLSANQNVITTVWSQRNLERGKTLKFSKQILLTGQKNQGETMPVDVSNELLSLTSPSEQSRAVLRELNDVQYLEIWKHNNLIRTVDLNALAAHGSVYTDGEFGSLQWSPDEEKLLYIAELKVPKSEPFYKRQPVKNGEGGDAADKPKSKGDEHLFTQDWGEQLVGKKRGVVVEYHIENDQVEILKGLPDNVCPGQVVYSPDGGYVVGVAYLTEPRKLGLIYCTNRRSTIFRLDLQGNYTSLNLGENSAVKSPVFTPDGKYLIWLQRNAGGPHNAVMSLVKAQVPLEENPTTSVVIDIVKTESETDNGSKFYGLYNSGFIKRCFASGNRLVLSTNQKNTINTYIIDLDSANKITELSYSEGSQIVLDVFEDVVLVNRRNYLKQDKLALCKLPPKTQSDAFPTWVELTRDIVIPGLEGCIYEYMDLTQDSGDVRTFNSIYVGPKSGGPRSIPLIVWPHGGPHSAFANNFSLEASLFLSLGYAVLFINYRGSIGQGEDSVNFLLGKVGKSDVSDCILATHSVLNSQPSINPNALVLVGGSHGGFLVAHLSGQYPDMFKAVVARNPVIDIASMSIISDIPDWCYVEAGSEYTQVGKPDEKLLVAMREASPIEFAHRVKAPTLLQLGSKDLRVPPHQGMEYFTRLKANGVEVKVNLYDDNHPLGTVPNEMDQLINTVLWIQNHVA